MLPGANLESRIFNLLANVSEQSYIYFADLDTDTSRWSKAAVRFFGLPGEYIEDTAAFFSSRIHPDDLHIFLNDMGAIFRGESDRHDCEYRMLNAVNSYVWVRCRGSVERGANGEHSLFSGSIVNLGSVSHTDPITSLPSAHEASMQLEEALQNGQSGIMMFFGLDNFKRINDMFGFPAGDEILRFLGRELRKLHFGTFFRLDGDKFQCILPAGSNNNAERMFDKVQEILSAAPRINGYAVQLTASCGVVRFPEDGTHPGPLRAQGEYALELAKNTRRGSLAYYSPTMHQKTLTMYKIQESLRQAIANNFEGFSLHYQPLVRESDNSIFGAEALLRFSSPGLTAVSPADFIPILENDGSINVVGQWTLRTALAQVSKWREIIPDFCVSVNVSYVQMSQPEFRSMVMTELKRSGVTPDGLILELTESCRYSEPRQLQEDFTYFSNQNIKMALDDFGTGYSSIAILRTLTPPWIKIDHTFVSSITENRFDEAIIEYILQLCQHAHIKVCVEGIENMDILRIVRRYHPQLLQGYYFSKPLPADQFEAHYITAHCTSNRGM